MKKIIDIIKNNFVYLVKFGMVGCLNTAIDFVVFYFLSGFIHDIAAKAISFSVSVINSYLCNKFWTFKSDEKVNTKEVAKFICVNILTLCINLFMYWIWSDILHLGKVVSFILTAPFVTLANFCLNKLWVFK